MNEIRQLLAKKIETVTESDFDKVALEIFHYQAHYNLLYADYLRLLRIDPQSVTDILDIPFLPIQFFKNYIIKTGDWDPEIIFTSSGTTGQVTSQHLVRDLEFYKKNTYKGFEYFFDSVNQYCILALLPSYLERSGSSLVVMADHFIQQSDYKQSGFFLYNTGDLIKTLENCKKNQIPTLLLGVSFALLDIAAQHSLDLSGIMIMETGGFKGRRKEMIREELHEILCDRFNVQSVHSEYGMTELFSQAYSRKDGIFYTSPTMRVITRQIMDPFSIEQRNKTGVINVIDLANLDTISFIATDDLGKVYDDGSFSVLGRLDASDLRGCNLMIQ